MSTIKFWVWLSSLQGLRPRVKYELVEAFGDPEAVYYADDRKLIDRCALSDSERAALNDKSLGRAGEILESCHSNGVSVITLLDATYPKRLQNIYDPPIVLYCRGRLPAVDEEPVIAVVGTRKATPYGIKMAEKMGYELSRAGGLVVTGLAAGVDSASARGALMAGGSCIGVLGCAIDSVYPQWNGPLYDDVSAVGALVSEYPPGTPIRSSNFPQRNRIISGLSLGVTVIEAPRGSGALITASRALDQGREVFAVPGNADAFNCLGSNRLIAEGAQLVSGGWDVLSGFSERFPDKLIKPDEKVLREFEKNRAATNHERDAKKPALTPKNPPETGKGFVKLRVKTDRKGIDKKKNPEYIDLRKQLYQLSEVQLSIVSVIDNKSVHVDDIIDRTGLPATTVLSELTVLQIKGYVSQESGKRFSLNISK